MLVDTAIKMGKQPKKELIPPAAREEREANGIVAGSKELAKKLTVESKVEAEPPTIPETETVVDPPEEVKRAKRMPRKKGNKLWCSKCKRYRSKEHFAKNKASKDGYHGWCKQCARAYSKAYQALKKAEAESEKATTPEA